MCLVLYCHAPVSNYDVGAHPEIFQSGGGGGAEKENFESKTFVDIPVSTRVHIKTRQKCYSFSLLPFQEDCLLFFALF